MVCQIISCKKEIKKMGVEPNRVFFPPASLSGEQTSVCRQAYAGLLWSKQFYHYIIHDWLHGDPDQPIPPRQRLAGRNSEPEWQHLFNRDVVSMPDKWEYPWVSSISL